MRSRATCAPTALDGGVVADVEVDDLDLAAELGRPASRVRRWLPGRPDQHEVGAGLREPEGDGLAEAATGAGDDGAPAVQVERRATARPPSGGHRSSSATGRQVGVGVVLAGHRPDEGVGAGAGAGVDGPRRRDDGLAVAHDEVAGGAGLAHEVEDPVVLVEVDVQVDLGAAVVQVRREGVPHRAVGDHGDAELEHRRLQLLAPRRSGRGCARWRPRRAERDRLDLGVAEQRRGVRRVRGRGDEVEGGVGAGEGDLAAAADEQAVEVVELELLAVDQDVPGLPDVDDAELAALQVGLGAEDLGPGRQLELAVPGTAPPTTSRSSCV